MQKLTLTGATLASSSHHNKNPNNHRSSSLEMTAPPLASQQQQQQQQYDHGHDHGNSHGHDHGHSHNHGGGGCGAAATPVRVVYTPPSEEDLRKASVEDIRTSLCTIIRMGSFTDAFEPLLNLIHTHRSDALQQIFNSNGDDDYSLLHWAAKRVDDVRFLELLCTKVKPETINIPSSDEVAMRPLHWVATEGGLPHASVLLKYGAHIEGLDGSGCTPLLIAAQYGHVDLVAFLLQRKANGVAVDKNRDSALHWAAYKGSIHVCGHLLFRGELNWTTQDAFGQTPLHLAALRGNTAVVRYLIQEGSAHETRRVLQLPDKNQRTPLDLAIIKKKPTVEMVLREHMKDKKCISAVKSAFLQMCSVHSWQLWFGFSTANDVDVSPTFPFHFMLFHIVLYSLWYPFVFTPMMNTSAGILWDYMGLHNVNFISMALLWYCVYKVRTTNPGTLDDRNPETAIYRKLYEETIESYSDEANANKNKGQLCHTCHIVRPLRSKHCRDKRRCVLLFDHHCPFVGNTIGLYNYKWFYLFLLFMTTSCLGFSVTLWIYLHRQFSWFLCIFGIYLSLFILFGGGMLVYHTQLAMVNLTTNEHINVSRYAYLKNERTGGYRNPFFHGWLNNFIDRFYPSKACYTLPIQQESLLQSNNEQRNDDDHHHQQHNIV